MTTQAQAQPATLTAAETKALSIIGSFVDTQQGIMSTATNAVAAESRRTAQTFAKTVTKPLTREHWRTVTRPALVALLVEKGLTEGTASSAASGQWAMLFHLAGAKLLSFEGTAKDLRMFVTCGDQKVAANSLSALKDFKLSFENDICVGVALKDASAGSGTPKEGRGAKQTRATKPDPKLAKLAKATNPVALRAQLMAVGDGKVEPTNAMRKGAAEALVMSAKALSGKGGFDKADEEFADAIRVAASWTDATKRKALIALVRKHSPSA